jgi:phosphatidate cytidylyltransferase
MFAPGRHPPSRDSFLLPVAAMTDVLRFTIPVFAVGALGMALGSRHVTAQVRRARWLKFAVYVLVVHVVLAAAWLGPAVAAAAMALVGVVGAEELLRARKSVRSSPDAGALVATVYVLVLCGALAFVIRNAAGMVTFVYLVVAAFDGFSQVGGQIAGRRPLAPSISPGKTVEGTVCGGGAAGIVAVLLRGFPGLDVATAAAWALLIAAAGLAGDLAASWEKRRAGIKDFGRVLPGHGGVLDRFDSFLAAAAAVEVVQAIRSVIGP